MIRLVEFLIKASVLLTFGTLIALSCIACSLILWDSIYIETAYKIKDLIIYGEEE